MGRTLLALGALLLVFGIRFQVPLSGAGVFCARDLHFFFIPLREALFRLIQAGEFPWLFPENFGGLPLAANPNAAFFWPGTWIYPLSEINGVILTQLFCALLAGWWAMRWCGFNRAAATVAAFCLLGSGVYQSLPCFLNATGLLLVLPLCLAAGVRLARAEHPAESRRWLTACALLLSLVIFAGEPAMGFLGILTTVVMALVAAGPERRGGVLLRITLALVLAVGLSFVQVLPSLEQLHRSARGARMPLESAAGACSVHPARLLTILLPGSGGDPTSPDPRESWLPGGFPYFDDIRPGMIPLLLALCALGDTRGRWLLLGFGCTAVFSCGIFLPGFEWIVTTLPGLQMLRYPEKWWLIATLLLCAAAGVGMQRLQTGAARAALPLTVLISLTLAAAAGVIGGRPESAIRWLGRLGLIAGDPSPDAISAAFSGDAHLWLGVAVALGLVAWLRSRNRLSSDLLFVLILLGWGAEMGERLPGSIPWGDPALFRRCPPVAESVKAGLDGGFFYDEGSTHTGILRRRAMEHGGIDPLRAMTGTVFGIPFFADNEIDRMAPLPLVKLWSTLAATPWSFEKAAALADFGVSLVRVPQAVLGSTAVALDLVALPGKSADVLVRLVSPRPRLSLETGSSISPLVPVASSPSRFAFDLDLPPAGGEVVLLVPGDPFWRAEIDGYATTIGCRFPEWNWGLKIPVSGGKHQVIVRYMNPWFGRGAALSLAFLALLGLCWKGSGFRRRNR